MVFLFWVALSAGVGYISKQFGRSWVVWTALSLLFSPAIGLVGLVIVDVTGTEPLEVRSEIKDSGSTAKEDTQDADTQNSWGTETEYPANQVFSDTTRKIFAYLGVAVGVVVAVAVLNLLIAYGLGHL